MMGLSVFATALVLLPTAFGSILRRLDAQSYAAVMSGPAPTCAIENGFDYVGNDLTNVPGNVTDCCDKCTRTIGCSAWSWSDHNQGTCWLKKIRGDIVVNPAVKSAILFEGLPPMCQVTNDIDYVGNDLARVDAKDVSLCCDLCHNYAGCRAYSWSDYQGGSCWLKDKVTQVISKPGVKSAEAYPSFTYTCFFTQEGIDYVGNDIANKPSASYGPCCEICNNYPGCNAWTWSGYNGGTCWLKSQKTDAEFKSGVVSAIADHRPPCAVQQDTDYYDNDLANVPGRDANECCGACRYYQNCRAFAWTDLNGGRCWLKSAKGDVVSKAGVQAGVLY